MITGKPISWATATASSGSSMAPSEPGTTGMSRAATIFLAVALSPISRICSAVGPMNVMLDASQVSANAALSARNPYPGWIASAPVSSAAAMMLGMRR